MQSMPSSAGGSRQQWSASEGTISSSVEDISLGMVDFALRPDGQAEQFHHAPRVTVTTARRIQRRNFTSQQERALLQKREDLRKHPHIRSALRAWWDMARKNSDGLIDKDEYVTMNLKIYRALMTQFDLGDAQRAIEAEWEWDAAVDSKCLNFARFAVSMFDLADTWTTSTDWREYVTFLLRLLKTVTKDGEWRSDQDIDALRDGKPQGEVLPSEIPELPSPMLLIGRPVGTPVISRPPSRMQGSRPISPMPSSQSTPSSPPSTKLYPMEIIARTPSTPSQLNSSPFLSASIPPDQREAKSVTLPDDAEILVLDAEPASSSSHPATPQRSLYEPRASASPSPYLRPQSASMSRNQSPLRPLSATLTRPVSGAMSRTSSPVVSRPKSAMSYTTSSSSFSSARKAESGRKPSLPSYMPSPNKEQKGFRLERVLAERMKYDATLTGHINSARLLGLMQSGHVPSEILLDHFSTEDPDSMAAQREVSSATTRITTTNTTNTNSSSMSSIHTVGEAVMSVDDAVGLSLDITRVTPKISRRPQSAQLRHTYSSLPPPNPPSPLQPPPRSSFTHSASNPDSDSYYSRVSSPMITFSTASSLSSPFIPKRRPMSAQPARPIHRVNPLFS